MKFRAYAAALAISVFSCSGIAMAGEPIPGLLDMLPKHIKDAGRIEVASDPQQPPYDFYDEDNKTLIGVEQELLKEVGERIGIPVNVTAAPFPTIIPGIQSGRFDLGASAFGDFIEREEIVDIVDVNYEAAGLVVVKGNPLGITKIGDMCGHRGAAHQGSTPLTLFEMQAERCPADKPLEILQFPTSDQAQLAVKSGRADAYIANVGVSAYATANQPEGGIQIELVTDSRYAVGYQGWIIDKSNPGLRDAVIKALQSMVDDGSYGAIFDKWNLSQNVLETITYNDAKRFPKEEYFNVD
ncbi:ABC transporter substrate-binding protein [Brucellaceae bacterium C25G]